MTGRPIIFSASMVRALLAGRKTQTRRPVSPGTCEVLGSRVTAKSPAWAGLKFDRAEARTKCPLTGVARPHLGVPWVHPEDEANGMEADAIYRVDPIVSVGDRFYVREAWTHDAADLGELRAKVEDAFPDFSYGPFYRATEPAPDTMRWRSPIHMPRWASRLTLIITEVRVERLASISREDAIAEGAMMRPRCSGYRDLSDGWSMDWSQIGQRSQFATGEGGTLTERDIAHGSPVAAFGGFINGLHDPRWNYKGDGIFGANPWVVAISFRPVLANIDAHPKAGGLQDERGVR